MSTARHTLKDYMLQYSTGCMIGGLLRKEGEAVVCMIGGLLRIEGEDVVMGR